jgi:hypothetical protein
MLRPHGFGPKHLSSLLLLALEGRGFNPAVKMLFVTIPLALSYPRNAFRRRLPVSFRSQRQLQTPLHVYLLDNSANL